MPEQKLLTASEVYDVIECIDELLQIVKRDCLDGVTVEDAKLFVLKLEAKLQNSERLREHV